jgi:aminoglycoside phosphotransferase (APT) family kinase protein
VAAGREAGIEVSSPELLHEGFSVLVALAPSPLVARVPIVLTPGRTLAALQAQQRRELQAVAWLAEAGHPVVKPSSLASAEPIEASGFSITLWERVAVDPAAPADYAANAGRVALLHGTLSHYLADLPFMAPLQAMVPQCLAFLEGHRELITDADLDRARQEWEILGPLFSSRDAFEARFPGVPLQAVHGDAPYYNMIPTPDGPLDADFEEITCGPREWDLALVGPDGVHAYDEAAARQGDRVTDPVVRRLAEAARLLQVAACLALVPQWPALADSLTPMLDLWRSTPVAGGS